MVRVCRRTGGCHRMHGKSFIVYQDKCVPAAGLKVLPQSLNHPIISNTTPLYQLFDRGPCTQFDSVMRVIEFGIPFIGACHACHWCLSCLPLMFVRLAINGFKYLCCVVTKWCIAIFVSRKQYVTQRKEELVRYWIVCTHERMKKIYRWNHARMCRMHYIILPSL